MLSINGCVTTNIHVPPPPPLRTNVRYDTRIIRNKSRNYLAKYINFQQNRISRSVKTVHIHLFVKNRKLHKFSTANSNFAKIEYF